MLICLVFISVLVMIEGMIEVLLVVVIVLLLVLILLVLRNSGGRGVRSGEIEAAVTNTWVNLGLDEKLGAVESHARDIRDSYRSFEQMLRVPSERGGFGEISLEAIIADQLPQDMYGVRERVLGVVPDAHIRSTVGVICIDSKFPLENYSRMLGAEDAESRERFKRQFLRDVRGHLDKIASDYVCPEEGSAEFAFAYIPSESVYYFLVTEAFEMLREYTRRGVQVVSPLTLSHKIELIKAGVHAKKLSEEAERVRDDLARLSRVFDEVDEMWRILYGTHLRNLRGKAEELDRAYKNLRDEFDRVSELSEE